MRSGLNSLKTKVDKLYVDKLKPVPTNLNKLSDMVEKEFVKKMCVMNWLKNLMLLILVHKTDYIAKIKDIEDKIPSVTN